jgi:hypothetical protein
MDWLDQYLDGMAQYRVAESPADTHTWGPAKPSRQQLSMIQDSMAFDMQQRNLIREARQELEESTQGPGAMSEHDVAIGIGADPGSPTVQYVPPAATPDPYSYAYDFSTEVILFSALGNIPDEWLFLKGYDVGAVTFGTSVSSIGDLAINGMNISNIIIPDNVTSIGNESFRSCPFLTSVVLSNNLTKLGDNAFMQCAISELTIPNSLRNIGTESFASNNIQNLTLGTGLTAIAPGAFAYNYNLTTLVVPDQVKRIEGGGTQYLGAFANCGLNNIVWGSGLTYIGEFAFCQNALTELVLPSGLRDIAANAFENNQLTHLIIPGSVINIERQVFAFNSNLASVSCFNTSSSFTGYIPDAFQGTSDPLIIHARISDDTWTPGAQSFQGNDNVTVIRDLN